MYESENGAFSHESRTIFFVTSVPEVRLRTIFWAVPGSWGLGNFNLIFLKSSTEKIIIIPKTAIFSTIFKNTPKMAFFRTKNSTERRTFGTRMMKKNYIIVFFWSNFVNKNAVLYFHFQVWIKRYKVVNFFVLKFIFFHKNKKLYSFLKK